MNKMLCVEMFPGIGEYEDAVGSEVVYYMSGAETFASFATESHAPTARCVTVREAREVRT
jgi:hypothetical protein